VLPSSAALSVVDLRETEVFGRLAVHAKIRAGWLAVKIYSDLYSGSVTWGGWGSDPRPGGLDLRPGALGALAARIPRAVTLTPPVAPFARMTRATNRSTPHHGPHRMLVTERYCHPANKRVPAPGGVRPPEESRTLLTAKPLDLDYQHEIIRRVHQEGDQAPALRAEYSERRGIETSSRSSRAGTAPDPRSQPRP
jgi:hypothetical protein